MRAGSGGFSAAAASVRASVAENDAPAVFPAAKPCGGATTGRAATPATPSLSSSPRRAATMELLAPAGGREQLEYAVHFGADAVYLASERFGMRRRAENFAEADIADAVAFAHARGVRVYVTANTLMNDSDVDDLPRYFALLADAGVDAVIVSDLGALSIARRAAPGLGIHLSTQASCMNAQAARAYYDLGVRRIVVAREMSLAQIAELRRRIPDDLQIEAFAHGAMCMAYSGRCLISDYLAGPARGANVGRCAQPCRWEYSLVERTRPGQRFDVVEDERGSAIMSSRDMNMLAHIDELSAAGVNSLKIEGRAKGAYYAAAVTNAYRHVLDGAPADRWQAELETTSHRPWSTGFYYGQPGQSVGDVQYERAYHMAACVESCEPAGPGDAALASVESGPIAAALAPEGASVSAFASDAGSFPASCGVLGAASAPPPDAPSWRVTLACRNRFREGEELEVLSPASDVFRVAARGLLWHAAPEADVSEVERRGGGVALGPDPGREGGLLVRVDVANRTMERYSILSPRPLAEGDILRIARPGQ